MDKPKSMSVKDYLVRILSVRMNVPKATVEAVVDFQMKEAHDAMLNNNSIEISGFGKFWYNKKKAQKKLEKNESKVVAFSKALEDPTLTDQKLQSYKLKLENTLKVIETIKPKLHGIQQSTRGLEEQVNSLIEAKGLDRGSEQGEAGDL